MILGDTNLEDTFSGVKSEIGHLRMFGCPIYIHVTMDTSVENTERGGGELIFLVISNFSLP